jgi:hypothetical protein
MLRKQLIGKYINTDDIMHVVWHDSSMFYVQAIKTILLLFLLFISYAIVDQYVTYPYLEWIFGVLGIIVFVKYILDFLNIYLDTIVMSHNGITFLTWDSLFDYKTDFFWWEAIETVSHQQDSFWDKFWGRGNLLVQLGESISFPFENAANPKRQVTLMLQQRELFLHQQNEDFSEDILPSGGNKEHMQIVMEALGEIVHEYAQKKRVREEDEEEEEY